MAITTQKTNLLTFYKNNPLNQAVSGYFFTLVFGKPSIEIMQITGEH